MMMRPAIFQTFAALVNPPPQTWAGVDGLCGEINK